MDFELTPRQKRVYDTVGELSRTVFKPNAAKHDTEASTPRENLKALFEAGFNGITISESFGGMGSGAAGTDPLLYLLAVEQTARGDLSTAQCFHIHCHGAHYVDQVGTEEQRERVLRPVLESGSLLNATGSEPGRTSRGAYNLVTSAERAEGGYVLNGMKNYATLGADVDYNLIFAGIPGEPAGQGHLSVLVPQDASGFSVIDGSWNPMGMRGACSPSLKLDNCFVDDRNVLGDLGIYPRERWQARFHLSFAAQYLGGAEAIFDLLCEYLPKRGTASDSYTQLRLGEIRVGTESVRWLIYRAAWQWTQGNREAAELSSICAKHRALENAVIAMDKGAQIVGSSAFWADSAMSRLFRDLRIHTLHENLDTTAAILGKYHLGQPFDTTARL